MKASNVIENLLKHFPEENSRAWDEMSPTSQRHLSFIRNQATHWLEKDKASTVTVTISPTPVNIYKEANLVADGIADGNDSFMRALLTAMLVANTTDLVK